MLKWKMSRIPGTWRLDRKVQDAPPDPYKGKLEIEKERFRNDEKVHELPAIFHYWSNKYVAPLLAEFGVTQAEELYCRYLNTSAQGCNGRTAAFLSVGAGNCDVEVRVAGRLKQAGVSRFVIDCLELNPAMLERGRKHAAEAGLTAELAFIEGDFNTWRATRQYAAVIAHHSLHHVVALEHLFDEIKRCLLPGGYFVTSDMIGRNGHLRWPEALDSVQRFWRELPVEYRWNRPLRRYEEEYINHDCSQEGFEGIRAQDILPLLIERFDFHLFVPFANVIEIFVSRTFGHNFDATGTWDREFIDRVQEFDEKGLRSGALTPTQMMAVMTPEPCREHNYSRGLTPSQCVRKPSDAPPKEPAGLSITTTSLQIWQPPATPPSNAKAPAGAHGTPERSVLLPVEVAVKDSSSPPQIATQRYTLHVRNLAAVSFPSDPDHGAEDPMPFRPLSANGGVAPYAWSIADGMLLAGFSLNSKSGVISYETRPAAPERSKDDAPRQDPDSTRCGVIPHIAAGGSWSTSIYLLNPSIGKLSATVRLWRDDGSPLSIPLATRSGAQQTASLQEIIPPCGSLEITTKIDTGPHETGWAEVLSSSWVTGYVVYRYTSPNGVRAEHALSFFPGERSILLVFDNTGNTETGVAITNLSETPAVIASTLWSEEGDPIASQQLHLRALGHMSFLLREQFPTAAAHRGVLILRSQEKATIAGLSLAFPSAGGFRPLPVLSGPTD
jgi:SAM-dependent methyltransferase